MSRLLHAGSAVVDYVYRIDALPLAGTEKIAMTHGRIAGGGFNLMVAARRTGMRVAFAGRHGTGPNGDFLRAALAAEDIRTLTEPDPEHDTGNCVVLITADAERTFVSWPGAEGIQQADLLSAIALKPGDWVFTSGYTLAYPGSRDTLADWIETLPGSIPLVFDPTPAVTDIPRPILARALARTTWLSCNAAEAAVISGHPELAAQADSLVKHHCGRAEGIIIRSGAGGAHLSLRDGTAHTIPAFEVQALDTNGAGDTHIGAFVSALARGAAPVEAVRYANAAAAISVTRHGGSSGPTDAEVRAFLAAREDPRPPAKTVEQ